MSSLATIQKHYLRLLRNWPADHLRGLTIQYSIPRRLTLLSLPPSTSTSVLSTPSTITTTTSSTTSTSTTSSSTTPPTTSATITSAATHPTTLPENPTPRPTLSEESSVAALYSLLENRYTEHYPTSARMLNPGFKEGYYADLAHELEEAPRRTWLQRTWLRWGKLVRFS